MHVDSGGYGSSCGPEVRIVVYILPVYIYVLWSCYATYSIGTNVVGCITMVI